MAEIILLIAKADFTGLVDLAQNLPDAKLNPRIYEAQQFDLKPLLGDDMYFDLLNNQDKDTYLPLLAGTDKQQGLKPIVVYFTAARLMRRLDLNITPSGMMIKRNEFSDHADIKAISAAATELENIALAYWNDVKNYIQSKGKAVYPLFKDFCGCCDAPSGYRPRVYGIGGR